MSKSPYRHYCVTLCDGEYRYLIDGVVVTDQTDAECSTFGLLRDAISTAKPQRSITAEKWDR